MARTRARYIARVILDQVELELEADHGGFVIDGVVPAYPTKTTIEENTLLNWWPDTDPELEGFFVTGGSQWGPFAIKVRLLDNDPGPPDGRWEDVVEVAIDTAGVITVNDVVDGYRQSLKVPPGIYRMRLGASGRTEGYDQSVAFTAEDEDSETHEHFLIEVWVTAAAPAAVLRQDSRHARDLLNPPEPVWPAEREPGLAAAWAVVRDLRGEPGARRIPGELGDLSVELSFPGTPTKLFNRLRYASGWPPCMGGSGGTGDVLGETVYSDATLPEFEGAYDSVGHIAKTLLDLQKPHRLAMGWNWVPEVDASPSRPFPLDARPRLLAADSTVTITFVRIKAPGDEATACVVRLKHVGVPLAWSTDLKDLWTWDLTRRAQL